MLKNRLISALLIASLVAGATACSMNSGNGQGTDSTSNTVAEDQEPGDGETNDISDSDGSKDADTDGTAGGPEDTTDTTDTTTDTKNAKKLVVPDASEDYALFAYEYGNMAWGYQSAKLFILNNGDVYAFENAAGTAKDQKTRDLAVTYLKTYSKPSYHLTVRQLKELYDLCKAVDPNVETSEKGTAKDMGSYTFTFFDPETKGELTIIKTGDWTMTTDDKTLKKAQKKAESILDKKGVMNADLYLSLSSPIVNVPYGGKALIGKNMSFDSYAKLLEFCQKNGIDVEKYLSDNVKKSFEQAKYIVLQVYDTNVMVDGYLETDGQEWRFLPSLADYEHNPDFDGKVTVAISRCDKFEKNDYVNENGTPWK